MFKKKNVKSVIITPSFHHLFMTWIRRCRQKGLLPKFQLIQILHLGKHPRIKARKSIHESTLISTVIQGRAQELRCLFVSTDVSAMFGVNIYWLQVSDCRILKHWKMLCLEIIVQQQIFVPVSKTSSKFASMFCQK